MGQRWEKAKADSHGWVFKREVAIAVLCGGLAVGAVAATGGTRMNLGNEIIVVASALLGVLLLPPLELAWNYLKAPKRLLRARIEELEQLVPPADDLDDAQLAQECSELGNAIQEFVMGRANEKPPLEPADLDPVTGLPLADSEAFQRATRLGHDLQTQHAYESRFAGRVFSIVRVLRDRGDMQQDEIAALNYPNSVAEIDQVGERLEKLGRRLRGGPS